MKTYQILIFLMWVETFHIVFICILLRLNWSGLLKKYFYLNNLFFQSFYNHSEIFKS